MTITCGGTVIGAGDIILADEVGIVAVPKMIAADILAAALKEAELEEAARRRIGEGKTIDELLTEFGRI